MRHGIVLKHFSARDVVSRWDVVEVHRRATSLAAARFLDTLLERFPFPVQALQVDGGSEFAAEFEQACQQKELPLFVLPPKSPKLNGHVEGAHRTHYEEFYQVRASSRMEDRTAYGILVRTRGLRMRLGVPIYCHWHDRQFQWPRLHGPRGAPNPRT